MVMFGQELGRLLLNGRYAVCTTIEESQLMCDFLANDPRHPGIYGLDAEFMNYHMDWVDWGKKEAGPLANLAKTKLDIALHGQRYSKGRFAVVVQVCRADHHTIMGIVPISLIKLLQNARGIIGFTSNCDLTALANIHVRFSDIKIRADTSQIQRFLKSNRSLDYVCDMNPDLYKRLVEGTADFYCTGNSLAAIEIKTLTSRERIMTLKRATKREPLSLAILDFPPPRIANGEAIDLRAQAEREAYRHLDDNLAAFIVCFMPPYHTEMPPAAREFAELRSVHLRNQLPQDPRLLPEQIEALVAKFFNILTEYYTNRVV
uniref:Uncharacterized protein n=1 Tax=Romanomermis culicivorax TaxID=13658 RepID=A0A915JEI4_ROMCU